jgi:FkbM family methyltransferase
MKSLGHYVQRTTILISQIFLPPKIRKVKQVTLPQFQLLVFANEAVGRLIWLFKSYEPEETELFSSFIKPEDVCLDIGGNIGYFSMIMAARATRGHVHVFEPIVINAAMINANKELNGFKNVTINNTAVGDQKGMVTFSVSDDSAFSSIKATGRFGEAENVSVPILRIDDYLAENKIDHIDIIKVDVEGAENMVIDGAKGLLSSNIKKPRLVLLELFDENLKPFGSSVAAIVEKMRGWGYAAHVTNPNGTLRPFSSEMSNIYPNLIFTPI